MYIFAIVLKRIMSILNYFSSDVNKRAKFIFNTIAPVYSKVDKALMNNYTKSIELLKNEIDFDGKSVLDVGTGTGAWAAMFLKYGVTKVHGIDFSTKMLEVGRKKHPEISFSIGNIENLEGIEDNSFDIVTASYVVHGVKSDRRAIMISEMKRVSRKYVIIHDYVGRTPLFPRFLEFIEKSDYRNLKKYFCSELKAKFSETKKIISNRGSGLYIAVK